MDFQSSMQHLGFRYLPKTKTWEDLNDSVALQGFDFLRGTQWFVAFLKSWATQCGTQYTAVNHVPDGATFRCWTRCFFLRVGPEVVAALDRAFRQRGATAVKSVKKSFYGFSHFMGMFFDSLGPDRSVAHFHQRANFSGGVKGLKPPTNDSIEDASNNTALIWGCHRDKCQILWLSAPEVHCASASFA